MFRGNRNRTPVVKMSPIKYTANKQIDEDILRMSIKDTRI